MLTHKKYYGMAKLPLMTNGAYEIPFFSFFLHHCLQTHKLQLFLKLKIPLFLINP
jgi:hypothetical protein